jgi:hypothetical protein
LLTTAYHLLARQTSYRDLGTDYYDRRHAERVRNRAIHTLEGKGRRRVDSRLVLGDGAAQVGLELLGPGRLETADAWVSERFGERASTPAATVSVALELPTSLGFRLRCLE